MFLWTTLTSNRGNTVNVLGIQLSNFDFNVSIECSVHCIILQLIYAIDFSIFDGPKLAHTVKGADLFSLYPFTINFL